MDKLQSYITIHLELDTCHIDYYFMALLVNAVYKYFIIPSKRNPMQTKNETCLFLHNTYKIILQKYVILNST